MKVTSHRFLDEVEAYKFLCDRVDAILEKLGPYFFDQNLYTLVKQGNQVDGGVLVLWRYGHLYLQGTILRDDMNHSILTLIEYEPMIDVGVLCE